MVLGQLNFMVSSVEFVVIIGCNGGGKSTSAKLITGLYIPESGEILLDGQLITDENREWYRQHFSSIFSAFFFFYLLFFFSLLYFFNLSSYFLL